MIIDWWKIAINIIGGLSLFLYGMLLMTNSLKTAAGNGLKVLLSKMTKNRFTALLAGTGITSIIQSSSVTTVLLVGFVSANLISFPQTLGVILGANIGTTITAQIIAFKITDYALLIVAVGYLVNILFNNKKSKEIGLIIIGLGLVFLGMNLMSEATAPLRSYKPIIDLMSKFNSPIWGILFGFVFTAIIQSSSATTGMVIVLAGHNLIDLQAGISIIIGANVGTCVTALLAAINKPRPAVQVAISHIFFKITGALMWVFLIPQLEQIVRFIGEGTLPRQIANAHTVFNVINAMVFMCLLTPISKLIQFILPIKRPKDTIPLLNSYYLENIDLALDMVETNIQEMATNVTIITKEAFKIACTGTEVELQELRGKDKDIDKYQSKILAYMGQIQRQNLTESQSTILKHQIEVANILESIGDLISTNLVEATEHRITNNYIISEKTQEQLFNLYEKSIDVFNNAIIAYKLKQLKIAKDVINSKKEFSLLFSQVKSHIFSRLSTTSQNNIQSIRIELELLEITRQIHVLSRRLSRKIE